MINLLQQNQINTHTNTKTQKTVKYLRYNYAKFNGEVSTKSLGLCKYIMNKLDT